MTEGTLSAEELKDAYLQHVVENTMSEVSWNGEYLVLAFENAFEAPDVFVRPVEGRWEVSDIGLALSDLEMRGWDASSDKVLGVVGVMEAAHGFKLNGDRQFVRTVPREELGRAVSALIQLVTTMRACELWAEWKPPEGE